LGFTNIFWVLENLFLNKELYILVFCEKYKRKKFGQYQFIRYATSYIQQSFLKSFPLCYEVNQRTHTA